MINAKIIFFFFFFFFTACTIPIALKTKNFIAKDCIFLNGYFSKKEKDCIKIVDFSMVQSVYEQKFSQRFIGLWKIIYERKNSCKCEKLDFSIPFGYRYFFYAGDNEFLFGNFFSLKIENCFDSLLTNSKIELLKQQFPKSDTAAWRKIKDKLNHKHFLDMSFKGRVFFSVIDKRKNYIST